MQAGFSVSMAFDCSNCDDQNFLCSFCVDPTWLEDCIVFKTILYLLMNKKNMRKLLFFCTQKFLCILIQQLFEMITLHIQFLFFGRLEEWSEITTQHMFWHTRNWRKNILMKWKAWASTTRDSECTFFMTLCTFSKTFEIIFCAIRYSCFHGSSFLDLG